MSMLSLSQNLVDDINKSLDMINAGFHVNTKKSDLYNYSRILYLILHRLAITLEMDFEEKFELEDVVSENSMVISITKWGNEIYALLLTFTGQELMDGLTREESEGILNEFEIDELLPDPGTYLSIMRPDSEKVILQKYYGRQIL